MLGNKRLKEDKQLFIDFNEAAAFYYSQAAVAIDPRVKAYYLMRVRECGARAEKLGLGE